MCGIVGYTGSQRAAGILLRGLKRLEYRGYDSAGLTVQHDGTLLTTKASGHLKNLRERVRDGADMPGTCGIGHTRWATHGASTEVNAHPHLSGDGMFAVVHNGIIENYATLREELSARGYAFRSETDTEVVVHLLDMYYSGELKTAVMKATARLQGSFALGVVCASHPGILVAAKSASPLIIGMGVEENFFASDVTALVEHTRSIIDLEDGEFAVLSRGSVQIFDGAGRPLEKSISRVVWDVEAAEKGGYAHFMLKEIMEQPCALMAAIEPRVRDGRIVLSPEEFSPAALKNVRRVVITGCGSAYHAGCVARYLIEELCRLPVQVEFASELRCRADLIDDTVLVIAISQSGETADTIAAMKECRARGAHIVAVVNVVGSTVAKLADGVLYTWAGPEIAVATTKGYTTQVAVLSLLTVAMANVLGTIPPERYNLLVDGLCQLPQRTQRAIDLNPHVPYLARRCRTDGSMFFIGRYIDSAVCMEGALKLKEISYIPCEAYAAGELKHGTIALIDEGRLVVALACHEGLQGKMMNSIKEVKARGAHVLAVVTEHNHGIFTEADDALFVPDGDPLLMAVPEIVPLQLLAYHIALENVCDIDKPRNLAKSVTVE